MEIERKFLLRTLPPGLDDAPAQVIVQGYLALTPEGVEVRVRRKGDQHFLTIKHGGSLSRIEVELPLPAPEFDTLWPLTAGRRLRKTRREWPGPDGLTVEIDLYEDTLAGLQVAEVEFPDEENAHRFQPPDFFGREITGAPEYRNETLTRVGLPTEKEEGGFELSPRQTFAANFVRLARDRFTVVLASLAGDPEKGGPDAHAVHAARKDLKRLRALLRLARAGLGEETFRRENTTARDAGRELSAVRDAQVLIKALETLKGELYGRVAPETLESVHGWLQAGVEAAGNALRTQDRLPRAVALLSAARERIDTWPWQHGEDAWRVPGEGLQKVYRAARRAMHRAASDGQEGDFHEWRKQVKRLGAHVQLLGPLSPRRSGVMDKALGKLADRLGDEHDLAVLADTLAQHHDPAVSPTDLEVIARVIGERRTELRKKACKRGRRFFRAGAGKFARRWHACWDGWRARQG